MADPTTVSNTPLTDYTVLTDEVADATLGTGKAQYVKLIDGTLDGTAKSLIDGHGALYVSDQRIYALLQEMLLRGGPEGAMVQALARSNDTVSATIASDAVMIEDRPVVAQFAFANVAASQTDSLLAPVPPGKRVRAIVFRLHTGGTATNVTFNTRKPGTAGVACSETFATAANGGHHGAFCPVGHFQTNIGEDLTVTTGAGSTVGIGLTYIAF